MTPAGARAPPSLNRVRGRLLDRIPAEALEVFEVGRNIARYRNWLNVLRSFIVES